MNICLPSSGIEGDSSSGGARYSCQLVERLTNAGHDVQVLLADHLPCGAPLAHVHRLGWRRGLKPWLLPFVMAPAIARLWKAQRFDLLISHSAGYTGPAAILAKRFGGVTAPLVVHQHHCEPRWGLWALEKWAIRQADLVIVDSRFVEWQIRSEHRLRPKRLEVIHPGAPDDLKPHPLSDLRSGDFLRYVLAIGSCVRRKDPLGAVRAFTRAAAASGQRWRLQWIGDGPLRHRGEVEGRSAGGVQFLGRVEESTKRAYLANSDLFLHCSRLEGFPLAVLEAQAAGLPVVGYRAASMPELVLHGETGLLADPGDERALADALRRLMMDTRMRERMGQRAAASIRERGLVWSETVRRVAAAYESVL